MDEVGKGRTQGDRIVVANITHESGTYEEKEDTNTGRHYEEQEMSQVNHKRNVNEESGLRYIETEERHSENNIIIIM